MHRRARSEETMDKVPKPKLPISSNRVVWDCGSSLYDSFELQSFEKQLHSAITCRTLSMPHLIHHDAPSLRPPPPLPSSPALLSKKPMSKIMRSLRNVVRSVIRPARRSGKVDHDSNSSDELEDGFEKKERSYVIYDKSGSLSTIAEAPELDGFSPEIKSRVRRAASERFSSSYVPIGIYR